MRKILIFCTTVLFLVLANMGLSQLVDVGFYDLSFLVGLVSVVIIKFFTSSGGFASDSVRLSIQSRTGIKMDREEKTFTPSIAFYTAIGYTIYGFVTIFILYKDYFV
ncbi:hypothetical protein [Bacillus sp. 2205SS5-2]|uniref:hypothetical protein n=1 Tax=Bacillus sp. 2205SS5-2 TaxID=3109031 RepID=UPI0030061EBE